MNVNDIVIVSGGLATTNSVLFGKVGRVISINKREKNPVSVEFFNTKKQKRFKESELTVVKVGSY